MGLPIAHRERLKVVVIRLGAAYRNGWRREGGLQSRSSIPTSYQ